MRFADIITDIENISNVKNQPILVKNAVQHSLERMFTFFDFPYYLQEGQITTVAPYTTGTVTVASGSATVTGTGTAVFTSAMTGRKIRIASENPYYRILSVDTGANTLTLTNPYQGSETTLATFSIYKDEYRLAPDADKYKTLRQAQNNTFCLSLTPSFFDQAYSMPTSQSDPTFEIMSGTKLDTYTTGTISGLAGAKTITGSGTSYTSVEGLGRMSTIRAGNYVYTVKSVDSATQLTIYEDIAENIAALTTYEIKLNNLVVQLYQIPSAARNIYYRYFRIPEALVNVYDIPDMPHAWHWVLMYGALSIVLIQKGDVSNKQQEAEARFIDGLNMMKLKIGSFAPDRIWRKKSIDRFRRGLSDGIESGNFDRRWSR